MSITQLNPYLNYSGTAGEAIKLYESALGARVERLQRFGDFPAMQAPAEIKDRVVHALLHIGDGGILMISDTQPGDPVAPEGNTHVCLAFDDVADMTTKFDALAVGGTVTMPLADMFWGAKFGMLTDKYGIRWMFNCELKQP